MRLKRIGFLLGALFISLVVLEMCSLVIVHFRGGTVRELRQQRTEVIGKGDRTTILSGRVSLPHTLHPYFGYTFDPNVLGSGVINRHGFFGPDDILLHGNDHSYNVVIVGGSVAHNFFQFSGDFLKTKLAAFLGLSPKNVRIFSCSGTGYKQPQHLLVTAYFLSIGAKIDLLINIDGYNEAVIPHSNYDNPVKMSLFYPYQWQWIAGERSDAEVLRLIGKVELLDEFRKAFANAFEGFPLRFSATATLLWSTADKAFSKISNRWATQAILKQNGQKSFSVTGYVPELTENEISKRIADNWLKSSELMSFLARENGFAYVHVLQPNQYIMNSKPFSAREKTIALRSPSDQISEERLRKGYALFSKKSRNLAAKGVNFCDATMIFSNVSEDIYVDECCHFNKKGSDLLAARILSCLKQTTDQEKSQLTAAPVPFRPNKAGVAAAGAGHTAIR